MLNIAQQTYVFIDGQYLRQRHREAMMAFFGVEGDLDLSPIMKQAGASRVYFYDAIDYERGATESDEDSKARIDNLQKQFSRINFLSGFHV
jgi:hypothetical protein